MTFDARALRGRISALMAGCCGILALVQPALVRAGPADKELLDLSIEELLHVEITSAAKKAQRVSESAAAVFVITQDDIHRSGARSIPEALRMAPGLQVAQIDANKWAVSARGFNGRFSNKLLVLMDGRTLYTPSFGGVFWDAQDTLMEDIDRIEIIRGPGGTLWGANAVNGVINIITRSSRESQGAQLIAGAAEGPSRNGSIRYGDMIGEDFSYRVYGKYLDEGANEDMAGKPTNDAWHIGRVGVRADWTPASRDQLSLTAEGYNGRDGDTLMRSTLTPPYSSITDAHQEMSGFFTVGRWKRHFAEGRELQTQVYFDKTNRDTMLFGERRASSVAEVQYRFPLGSRQDIVSGAGFRRDSYEFKTTSDVTVTPQSPTTTGFNGFIQDELQIVADRLSMTVGVDLEHNPLSENHLDVLPSGRLLWTVDERTHVWTAVTKAISTPSFQQTGASVRNASPVIPPGDVQNPFPAPIVTTVVGNRDVRSEKLVAYELGVRTQIGSVITLDTTVFRHEYRALRGATTTNVFCEPTNTPVALDPACLFTATDVVNQLQFLNGLHGHSTGVELAADWVPSSRFRLRAAYTYLDMKLYADQPGAGLAELAAFTPGQNPKQQVYVRGDWTIARSVDVDCAIRHVDQLASIGVPQYWSADTNLIWHASPRLELTLSGRNLLQHSHLEFISELSDIVPTRIERSLGAGFRWSY